MSDDSREDIRKLLKGFGIQADEAISEHLERAPGSGPLRLRLLLEDLTDYGDKAPEPGLRLDIEGSIRR